MSRKKRLISALGANATGQVVTILIQLASLPIFLSIWTLEDYGYWLILTAIPAYFALSDIGFLAVTINKMTIVAATGDTEKVNILFQTALKLCIAAMLAATFLSFIISISFNSLPLNSISNKATLVILVTTAVLAMSCGLFDAVFRSSGEFAQGTHLINGARLIEWLGMILGLIIGKTFLSAAVGQLIGRLVASVIGWKISRMRHPHIEWKIKKASTNELHEMLKPAVSFMAFPVANALSIQGMTLIVGHLFGVTFLAVFSSYRTVARILVQATTIVGRSFWPEISRSFGKNDTRSIFMLYRRGTLASILVATVLCVFLHFSGEWVLGFWTRGVVPYDGLLFNLFLMATVLTSFWQMGMVLLAATNNHIYLSATYFFGSFFSLVVTYFLQNTFGKYSPVVGLIVFEIILTIMCVVHVRSFRESMEQVA